MKPLVGTTYRITNEEHALLHRREAVTRKLTPVKDEAFVLKAFNSSPETLTAEELMRAVILLRKELKDANARINDLSQINRSLR